MRPPIKGVPLDRAKVMRAIVARGMTMQQLADLAGLNPGTIRRGCEGYRIDPRSLMKLARALESVPVNAGIVAIIADPASEPSNGPVTAEKENERRAIASVARRGTPPARAKGRGGRDARPSRRATV